MTKTDRSSWLDHRGRSDRFFLNLFGDFSLSAPDGIVIDGLSRKARGIIAFLALTQGTASRNELATLLWSDRAVEQARASLRQTCYEMRRLLPATDPPLMAFRRDELVIDRKLLLTDIDPVDPDDTELNAPDPARAMLLVDLTGLSPAFDEWLTVERARRADARRRAAIDIALTALRARRWREAQQVGATLVAYDPTDTDAVQIAMRAFSETGDSNAVRHLYTRHTTALRRDRDQAPCEETTALFASVEGGRADVTQSLYHGSNTVADIRSTLVGRSDLLPIANGVPALSSKPSIAVMPFTNLSNDPEKAYLAEGIVEEVVASLARFKSLFVIAAGANLLTSGKLVSPHDAARQLGVGYLLKGSVRTASGRIRITVHLVEAESGVAIWTTTLDETMEDIFALQDRVAEHVAGVLEPAVQDQDIVRTAQRPTDNMNSYDLYLRSMQHFRLSRKDDMQAAIDLLDRAIELDPTYAIAMSQSCVCHRQMVDHRWADDIERYRTRGLELVERALAVAGTDTRVLSQVAASLPGLEGGFDRANRLVARAIALNPSSSFVWLISGSIHLRNGQPDIAAEHLETSIRLDPISSSANAYSRMYLASARFQQGRFDEAMGLFETTSLRLPISYVILASLYGYLGKPVHALEAIAHFKSLSENSIDDFAQIFFWRPQYRKLLLDGIALAEGRICPN